MILYEYKYNMDNNYSTFKNMFSYLFVCANL